VLTIAGGVILGVFGVIAISMGIYWAVTVNLIKSIGEGFRGFKEGMQGKTLNKPTRD
jgi:hypothetical protein